MRDRQQKMMVTEWFYNEKQTTENDRNSNGDREVS